MGKLLDNLLQTWEKMDENSVQNLGKKEQMKKKIDHEDFGCVLKSYFAKTNKKAKNTVGKKSSGGGESLWKMAIIFRLKIICLFEA